MSNHKTNFDGVSWQQTTHDNHTVTQPVLNLFCDMTAGCGKVARFGHDGGSFTRAEQLVAERFLEQLEQRKREPFSKHNPESFEAKRRSGQSGNYRP